MRPKAAGIYPNILGYDFRGNMRLCAPEDVARGCRAFHIWRHNPDGNGLPGLASDQSETTLQVAWRGTFCDAGHFSL